MASTSISVDPVENPAKITLLSDGTSYWDGGGAFGLVPRAKWSKLIAPDEQNRVPQELRCVLIEADGKRILVDCGVGNKPNPLREAQYDVRQPNGHLLDDLARHGVQPAGIDIVIFTHLHGDHSGWATQLDKAGATVPTFPNARYYVQRQEYVDATHTNERTRNTYFPDNYVALLEHGVLTLLDGDAQISPSVQVIATPGHTVGHQSVIVREVSPHHLITREASSSSSPSSSSSCPILILGDLATYMIQFARLAWVTAYDVLPLMTIESKRRWQGWALENQAILISPHETLMPMGQLVRKERGFLDVVAI